MNFLVIGFILLGSVNQPNNCLIEVPMANNNLTALKSRYFKPLALMENLLIVEAKEPGIEQLKEKGINFRMLLDPIDLIPAKEQFSLYLVTPPFQRKDEKERKFLEKNGKILTEDSFSYLFLTNQDFAEKLLELKYEITYISFQGIPLPEEEAKIEIHKTPFPTRNPIIEYLISRVTPGAVAQLVRELSGEVSVTVSGRTDTIRTRYALAAKNSSAIKYCSERLSAIIGIDSVKFHSFTWPTNRTDSNVIATKIGWVYPGRYLIIGGHIDCTSENPYVYAPGADDNATGTAAMMIAAKYLAPIPFKNTIRFIAWNTEEFGLHGSDAHAREAKNRNDTILGVLNGDMIATEISDYDSVRVYTGSRASSQAIGDTFYNVNLDYEIGLGVRRSTSMPANSDHYSYYIQGYDAVCVIEKDFCPYYHTTEDRITTPSFDTIFFSKVVKAMVATLATLAELETSIQDVGVAQIVAPTGIIDSGTTVVPQAVVINFYNNPVTFPVIFKIGTFYTDTMNMTLAPGAIDTVNFPAWTALQLGTYTTKCSTALTGDVNPVNNVLIDSVSVQIRDVGVTKIIAPTGIINSLTYLIPACSVYNYGTGTINYSIRMKIGDFYNESVLTSGHSPGTYRFITFPTWITIQNGTHTVSCSTELVYDFDGMNDKQTDSVIVSISPISNWFTMASIPSGASGRRPKSGSCMAGLEATGKIYFLKASNTQDFHIYTPDAGLGFWTDGETIPKGDRETGDGKKPKKGAAIAAYEPGNAIYALRGNNTVGFWKYQADTSEGQPSGWFKLQNIPAGAKKPKYGSGLVAVTKAGNDYIFAMKGSRTSEFYLYDINRDSWTQVTSPPVGASGRIGFKKGSCLCYDGNEFVYVLQGYYGSFFKYSVEADSWHELRQYNYKTYLNRDGRRKKPKDGAGLVYFNNNIYMLKGGNTREVWIYDIVADDWIQLDENWDIPIGEGKKVKGGGALTLLTSPLGTDIYASKGANTSEFYKHIQITFATAQYSTTAPEGILGKKLKDSDFKFTISSNPSINFIIVRYNLPYKVTATLKIYNVLGDVVYSEKSDKGFFRIEKLPAGIYVLRFEANDYKENRKIVVLK